MSLLVIMTISLSANSQNTPESIIEKFFDNYKNKGAELAVEEMYATNPWTIRVKDAINNIKTQLARFDNDLVGEYYGYEFLTKKQIGDSFILYSYFLKFDRQFLRLTFQFYKPNNEWRLNSFKFDDSFDEELEESAKIYYLELSQE
ncbi:hypothetical protein [Lutibacter maritimus]|nr:hypothetical protein [Lutibacter maritimus]